MKEAHGGSVTGAGSGGAPGTKKQSNGDRQQAEEGLGGGLERVDAGADVDVEMVEGEARGAKRVRVSEGTGVFTGGRGDIVSIVVPKRGEVEVINVDDDEEEEEEEEEEGKKGDETEEEEEEEEGMGEEVGDEIDVDVDIEESDNDSRDEGSETGGGGGGGGGSGTEASSDESD